jgi:hypothetical protein
MINYETMSNQSALKIRKIKAQKNFGQKKSEGVAFKCEGNIRCMASAESSTKLDVPSVQNSKHRYAIYYQGE